MILAFETRYVYRQSKHSDTLTDTSIVSMYHTIDVSLHPYIWQQKSFPFTARQVSAYTVVPPDATPFRSDFSYYATFFLSTNVLYTVKHPLNATSPLPRHATFKSWHYLATSL